MERCCFVKKSLKSIGNVLLRQQILKIHWKGVVSSRNPENPMERCCFEKNHWNPTQCPCVAITQCPCVAITQCPCVVTTQSCAGRRARGRAVAPTLTPLVFTPTPTHPLPHPQLLSPCWGGKSVAEGPWGMGPMGCGA